MNRIVQVILKHDGYIWGEYAWSQIVHRDKLPNTVRCRFVSKNLFSIGDTFAIPQNFLVDLKNTFNTVEFKKNIIRVYDDGEEYTIYVSIHCSVEEIAFMESTDFTCNLLDYRRDGLFIRHIPSCIAYDVSPYETVSRHIKEQLLVPVNIKSACVTYQKFLNDGWTMKDSNSYIFRSVICAYDDVNNFHFKQVSEKKCAICDSDFELEDVCVRTNCMHVYHIACIKEWMDKKMTCPLCREAIY